MILKREYNPKGIISALFLLYFCIKPSPDYGEFALLRKKIKFFKKSFEKHLTSFKACVMICKLTLRGKQLHLIGQIPQIAGWLKIDNCIEC